MQTRKSFSLPMVGGSSLLVIFAVLCLTVFTLLTLSTAQADSRLSASSVQAVSDYYAADLQAETILAQLRQGNIPSNVQADGNIYSYSCTISATQNLMIELKKEKESWIVLRWQAVSSTER